MPNAAIFGQAGNERGEVKFTELVRRIADSAQEAAARAGVFLNVPSTSEFTARKLWLEMPERSFKLICRETGLSYDDQIRRVDEAAEELNQDSQITLRVSASGLRASSGNWKKYNPREAGE